MDQGPCGLGALEQFAIMLPDYFIRVISAELGFQVIFGRGEKRADQRCLLLLKHDDHYYGLKSFPPILGCSYYCHVCDKGYNHEADSLGLLQIPRLVEKLTQTSTSSQVPGIRVQNLQGCSGGHHP